MHSWLLRSLRWAVVPIVLLQPGFPPAVTGAQAQIVRDSSRALTTPLTGRALPCTNGEIKGFPCRNVTLLAFLPPAALGGTFESGYDIWGWTDSATGREFVLLGGVTGTTFVEVTDPVNPVYLGRLPFHPIPGKPQVDPRTLTTQAEVSEAAYGKGAALGIPSIKVYRHYAFIAVESLDGGMQVFDLTQLRDVKAPPMVFQETAHYNEFGNAHTLTLNEATGFAYANATRTCGGGMHIVDVRTPTHPTFAGCHPGTMHDAQCVLYRGPDQKYRGREICVKYALNEMVVVDATDKASPQTLSSATYPNIGLVHQGWFTEDQRYVLLDDEEEPKGQTRTIVFDMKNLEDPVVITEWFNPNSTATAHNLYLRGRYMYQSNYAAGLRIVDIHDPKHLKEVGYLDTAPGLSGPGMMLGTWGNYPYLKHNVVAVASTGLFLLRLGR